MGAALRSRSGADRATAGRVRVTRAGACVAAALALLFVYYAWTATSSGNPFTKVTPFFFKYEDSDYYNLQADAFLHGRLSLDVPVDQRLLDAENPYVLNVPDEVPAPPDAAFYDDRFYLPWGPAPAVTTFLPPRLVGARIQENLAVTLYVFFGVLCGALALTLLVRRLVPETSRAVPWAGGAVLALAAAIPWILRRPTVYEVAISAAFCFMMAGLLVLVAELLREEAPRTSRLAGAGTLLGLGVLSRPNMAFVVVGVAGLAWVLRPDLGRRALALIVGLPALAGGVFMIYNMARFSGPLDFGNKWQVSGRDVRDIPYNDLSNIAPALYGYLVAPLRFSVGFPYVQLPPPPAAPISGKDGFGAEQTASILWAVPFALLALGLLRRHGRARAAAPRPATRAALALLATSALALLPGAFGVPGYTERYVLDFVPYLVMAATLAWAACVAGARTPRRAAWWRRAGLVLAAWSALIGVAIGFTGYYDSFKVLDRDRFRTLERAFSPLPTAMAMVAGRPLIASIASPGGYYGNHVDYTTLDVDRSSLRLASGEMASLTVVSPGGRDARLSFTLAGRSRGTFLVGQSGAEEATSIEVRNGSAATLPLRLHRGVSYLDLSVTAGDDVAASADGTPPSVELRAISLR
jgi:uncharacterized membrane protein YhaH (DUF805 family)